MKKILLLLLLPLTIIGQTTKVSDLPTVTTGLGGDFLIKNDSAGGTKKINIRNFKTTYFPTLPTHIISATSPITFSLGVISISQATSVNSGFLSNTDWNTFNGKQNGLTAGTGVTISTNTISIGQPVSSLDRPQFTRLRIFGDSPGIQMANTGANGIVTTVNTATLSIGTLSKPNLISLYDTTVIVNGILVLNSTHTVTAVSSATIGGSNTGDAIITAGSNISIAQSAQSFTVSMSSTPTVTSLNTNTITATTYNGIPYQFYLACTDETTAITATDTNSITIYAPFNFTVTSVFGMLRDAQASGSTFTFDIKKNGTTIFDTKPTIDNTHFTTLTASTAAVLSTTTFAAGDRIVINRHQVGTGGKGFKVAINYTR